MLAHTLLSIPVLISRTTSWLGVVVFVRSRGVDKVVFSAIYITKREEGDEMTDKLQQMDEINRRYVELARRHGLNPVWLREIIDLRNRGFNYSQIAKRTGISRETVANYSQRLMSLDRRDYWLLIVGAGLIIAGVGIVWYFLGRNGFSTPPSSPPTPKSGGTSRTQ